MFIFTHISDIHLPLQKVTAKELLNKRILGYLSWKHKRYKIHRLATLEDQIVQMKAHNPDHICITGDLTNIALASEIETAAQWLENLAPAERISLVPGNHDAYIRKGAILATRRWQAWMDQGTGFPYIHRRGPCAFIGLSSAVPTAPFMASGRIDALQLEKLDKVLYTIKAEGLVRIVLLHHPPQENAEPWRKALHDAAAFRAVIARAGAEVILHGHMHRAVQAELSGPEGKTVPVYGAGSASCINSPHYHMFRVEDGQLHLLNGPNIKL